MLKRAGVTVGLLAAGLVAAAALALAWAHVSIRALDPELPGWQELLAAGAAVPDADRPQRLAWVNTARQPMPRATVLDPRRDPQGAEPYVLAIPAFLLEWADGRGLLVDAGMDAEAAADLGGLFEWAGAAPLEPLTPLAEALGPALAGDWALVFSHLHVDHTQGIAALCAGRAAGAAPLPVFQTRAQAERSNHTTRAARQQLAAATCLAPRTLPAAPFVALPDRPGAFLVHAAGHTPGSQLILAFLAGARQPHVFVGDVVNHIAGIRAEVPKPRLYRWLVTPESEPRLSRLRRWLRSAEEAGSTLLVSHDEAHLVGLGLADGRFAQEGPP